MATADPNSLAAALPTVQKLDEGQKSIDNLNTSTEETIIDISEKQEPGQASRQSDPKNDGQETEHSAGFNNYLVSPWSQLLYLCTVLQSVI
jgi:hypothetical protein